MARRYKIDTDMILEFFDKMSKFNKTTGVAEFKIYNERSLQFELGKFLQDKFGKKYKVEVERNVERPPVNPDCTSIPSDKKNIDIFIYSNKYPERFAIELKYPRNDAEDNRFFAFSKDINFMEATKDSLENIKTYCLTIASDSDFYEKNDKENSKYKEMFEFYRTKEPDIPDSFSEPSLPDGTGPSFKITSRGKLVGVQLKHGYKIKWNRAHDRTTNADIFQCDGYEAPGKLPVYFYFVEI